MNRIQKLHYLRKSFESTKAMFITDYYKIKRYLLISKQEA